MTVEIFPGSACSPEVLLHRILEDMSDVKGAIVLTINEHGAVEIYMSQVSLATLAYASLKLQIHTSRVVEGDPPEGAELRVPPEAG